MYKLKKEFKLCCSHRLHNNDLSDEENKLLFGKCNNEPSHGHNYKVILCMESDTLNKKTGMLINFDKIKQIFKVVIDDNYDHQFLNECPGFGNKIIPTAENMARVFYHLLKFEIPSLKYVEIYETDGASAIYEV